MQDRGRDRDGNNTLYTGKNGASERAGSENDLG